MTARKNGPGLGCKARQPASIAPENEAFLAIPAALLDETLADPDLVSSVLLYHGLPGQFDPRRVGYIRKRETLLGQDLLGSAPVPVRRYRRRLRPWPVLAPGSTTIASTPPA